MNTIKFSHRYYKMPLKVEEGDSTLIQLFVCDYADLSNDFRAYDVSFPDKNGDCKEYELPTGKLIVLMIDTANDEGQSNLWTTIRRWTPEKERYYLSLVGQSVRIEINEKIE